MTRTDDINPTWARWLDRWDTQQEVYIAGREQRFEVMTSLLRTVTPDEPVVLDLACGPGTAGDRVLRALPSARCVAVDIDPVLLHIGRAGYGTHDGRLRWVRADLREPGWSDALGEGSFDAVVTTTATHWLSPPQLSSVYRELAGLLTEGGVLLNGDHFPTSPRLERIRKAIAQVKEDRHTAAVAAGADDWETWWSELEDVPELQDALAERRQIWPEGTAGGWAAPGLAFHEEALAEAGFRESALVWHELDEGLLLAVR